MEMAKLKVAQYGCGKMSAWTMRYVFESGAEIVAAFDMNPAIIGKDIGEVIGCPNKGVLIQPAEKAEEVLKQAKPDACIITTKSLMSDLKPVMMLMAKLGINTVTTCEEAFFPWNSSPAITTEIDELAKKTGCTICGTGYQDMSWGSLIDTLAGSCHRILKIKGSSSYNVEDYGIALAQVHGAGMDMETFVKEIAAADDISDEERKALIDKGEFLPSYMWSSNGWLCDKMGLKVKSQTQKCIPKTWHTELKSETLQMVIPAGHATGMAAVVTTETEEGITIETECIGKVYAPEEEDTNAWEIFGEPDLKCTISRPATVELTCATIVGRIPDIINAPAGFVTSSKMPTLTYRHKPLDAYIK